MSSGAVVQQAKAAITRQTGVHVVFTAHSSSTHATETIVADVGVAIGEESVREGSANLAIRVVSGHAYVKGNSAGLTKIFGMSASGAKKAGTRWVAWEAGTSQYADLKGDVTLSAVTALLPKVKGTRLSTEVVHGVTVYVLRWSTAATSSTPKLSNTLTLPNVGATLPLEQTSDVSGGTKATTDLSGWGEPVSVSPPASASTIASSKVAG